MVSINTNLSSLIAQNSLNKSTNALNQAIERMSTGYKINHASDNAANYSISTDMTTKLSAYDIASENTAMGLDLVNTAQDILNVMSDNASRLHALCTQARNGTYGADSLAAIQTEANSIVANLAMTYASAEYNGMSLFDLVSKFPDWAKEVKANAGTTGDVGPTGNVGLTSDLTPKYNGFIENPVDYTDEEVAAMERVANTQTFQSGHTYSITTKEELIKLADYVNSNKDTTGVTFVLGSDLDLGGMEWTPIGDYSTNSNYRFKGTFDGNGHTVRNYVINNPDKEYQGLFGYTANGSTIKNIGVEGEVTGKGSTGGLVGFTRGAVTNSYAAGHVTGTNTTGGLVGGAQGAVTNSYATGTVTGTNTTGGLVGGAQGAVTNSYATGTVTGEKYTGGLVGEAHGAVTNSYATGNVTGTDWNTGGLVGGAQGAVTNSYATGTVSGNDATGGLVGYTNNTVANSYATGTVTGTGNCTGGLVGWGYAKDAVTNSYATSTVTGQQYTGGLVGMAEGAVTNSYATGNVTGTYSIGGLVGSVHDKIKNSYATGNVTGIKAAGGLVGFVDGAVTNSYAAGHVTGEYNTGGLVGQTSTTAPVTNSYATGHVTGEYNTGGLMGCAQGAVTNSYATGTVSGTSNTGALLGATYDKIGLCAARAQNLDAVGNTHEFDDEITLVDLSTSLQVGINSDSSNQIVFDSTFNYNISAVASNIASDESLSAINTFLEQLNGKATELGAVSSRLESALDSIEVNINNLTSSRSTLRDADIAKVSSQYIRQQILQQASATLLSTANQTPSIALQLI